MCRVRDIVTCFSNEENHRLNHHLEPSLPPLRILWCWRTMLRIPWTAHRTNASILRQLKIIKRLSTTCLKRIFEYFDHIARRDGDNLEKIVITGKVEGKRPRGRSPIRWSDQISTALDTKVHTALNVAQSRVKWHKIVQEVVNGRGHRPQQ
ncbi:jg26125 [Pararge aegeria aegeria]|uniref:Jg26125 protein n=1 Tax=Pararge aegeria aegeria TaxID=348720 RepID=A0A8S4S2C3_9NEOP|nr:jg26125 [Pararge aegeria aegeria]